MKNTLIAVMVLVLIALSMNMFSQAQCINPAMTDDPFTMTYGGGTMPLNKDALNSLNAWCAWTITTGDTGITVGVIDGIYDTAHEDLKNTLRIADRRV